VARPLQPQAAVIAEIRPSISPPIEAVWKHVSAKASLVKAAGEKAALATVASAAAARPAAPVGTVRR